MLWWLLINIITSIVKDTVTSHDNSIFYFHSFQSKPNRTSSITIKEIEKFCEIELFTIKNNSSIWLMKDRIYIPNMDSTSCPSQWYPEMFFCSLLMCPHWLLLVNLMMHHIHRLGWNWYMREEIHQRSKICTGRFF